MSNNNDIIRVENVDAGYQVYQQGVKSLFKKYNIVLRNINIVVKDGERIVIIGESGSGKTTLLKVIMGLLKPIRGRVLVMNKDIYSLPWRKRIDILRHIGYVPQDPYRALNPSLKIKTILEEPLEAIGIENAEERIHEALRLVKLDKSILERYPQDLSGGMRQRVLIARAIVHDPEILILDEPTSALDVSIQAQIINLINEIHGNLKLAILTVTHDLGVAQYIADRAIILHNGAIVEEGPIDEVIRNPRTQYTKLLISSYKASL